MAVFLKSVKSKLLKKIQTPSQFRSSGTASQVAGGSQNSLLSWDGEEDHATSGQPCKPSTPNIIQQSPLRPAANGNKWIAATEPVAFDGSQKPAGFLSLKKDNVVASLLSEDSANVASNSLIGDSVERRSSSPATGQGVIALTETLRPDSSHVNDTWVTVSRNIPDFRTELADEELTVNTNKLSPAECIDGKNGMPSWYMSTLKSGDSVLPQVSMDRTSDVIFRYVIPDHW